MVAYWVRIVIFEACNKLLPLIEQSTAHWLRIPVTRFADLIMAPSLCEELAHFLQMPTIPLGFCVTCKERSHASIGADSDRWRPHRICVVPLLRALLHLPSFTA